MQSTTKQALKVGDLSFAEKVKEVSHAGLERCYQCHTCTLGCPVAYAMDYSPAQIVRMVQLGMKKEVLSSSTIWLCATCETCTARCPNEVDVLRVMDALKEMALDEQVEGKEKIAPIFHKTFLDTIRMMGKQYEVGMLVMLKMRTKDFLSDLNLGVKMMMKRKLKLLPSRTKDMPGVKAMFEKTRKEKS